MYVIELTVVGIGTQALRGTLYVIEPPLESTRGIADTPRKDEGPLRVDCEVDGGDAD